MYMKASLLITGFSMHSFIHSFAHPSSQPSHIILIICTLLGTIEISVSAWELRHKQVLMPGLNSEETSVYLPASRQKPLDSQVLVTHACNPSYSGGRDQENHSLKSAWANSLRDPILKKPITKKGW
jgi:hypothetical protein